MALSSTASLATTMIDMRDPCTSGHQNRVADIATAVATDLGLDPNRLKGLGIDKALAEIERGSGSAYDPDVVSVCVRLFRDDGFTLKA